LPKRGVVDHPEAAQLRAVRFSRRAPQPLAAIEGERSEDIFGFSLQITHLTESELQDWFKKKEPGRGPVKEVRAFQAGVLAGKKRGSFIIILN